MKNKNLTNAGFTCAHCGQAVLPAAQTARNHCPFCLWSLHVDAEIPGDRASGCRGLMEPAAIFSKQDEWIVIHRCAECGKEIRNKCASDDNFEIILAVGKNQTS